MPNNIKIGQIGEDLACRYLLNNKYKIVDRNYREKWGEIDIICKDKNGVLVFVEVKALKMFHPPLMHKWGVHGGVKQTEGYFTPEENLHSSKLKKVKRTAYLYANFHPDLINENWGWRIDLVAIEIGHPNPKTIPIIELLKSCQIRHYENI